MQAENRDESAPFRVSYLESDPTVNRYGGWKELGCDLLLWQLPGVVVILLGLFVMGHASIRPSGRGSPPGSVTRKW